jgi:hypothetical protein
MMKTMTMQTRKRMMKGGQKLNKKGKGMKQMMGGSKPQKGSDTETVPLAAFTMTLTASELDEQELVSTMEDCLFESLSEIYPNSLQSVDLMVDTGVHHCYLQDSTMVDFTGNADFSGPPPPQEEVVGGQDRILSNAEEVQEAIDNNEAIANDPVGVNDVQVDGAPTPSPTSPVLSSWAPSSSFSLVPSSSEFPSSFGSSLVPFSEFPSSETPSGPDFPTSFVPSFEFPTTSSETPSGPDFPSLVTSSSEFPSSFGSSLVPYSGFPSSETPSGPDFPTSFLPSFTSSETPSGPDFPTSFVPSFVFPTLTLEPTYSMWPTSSPTGADECQQPVTSEFTTTIGLENVGAQYQQAFIDAAARWSEIIIGDLPDVVVDQSDRDRNTCENVPDNIYDTYICASIQAIDGVGGVLGQAGPQVARYDSTGGSQTLIGIMQFDVEDVDRLVEKGTFPGVILSHIFAIGFALSNLSIFVKFRSFMKWAMW